uniref:Hematopoietic stem/progenitor cells protein like protein n=1 Tax=Rhipicephalus zambeziensis TaxID=60191 RepID=A0A224YED9_9ACAR
MKFVQWCISGWSRAVTSLARTSRHALPAASGSRSASSSPPDFPELSPRPEQAYHSAYTQPTKGRIYDKKPFRFECKKGRVYHWCTCGFSHTQPFCDGSHKNPHLKITLKPIRFVAEETRWYWFCNCKQTANRPYCDGTHKQPHIQEQPAVIK